MPRSTHDPKPELGLLHALRLSQRPRQRNPVPQRADLINQPLRVTRNRPLEAVQKEANSGRSRPGLQHQPENIRLNHIPKTVGGHGRY